MQGFLNLDKPIGITSRDAVDLVVRVVGRRTKVGHAGTLDPLASGVLVVAVGSATRLIERVQAQAKAYRATIRLGARSDTLDADGTVVEEVGPRVPGEAEVREALATQVGTIRQVPPQFSALKVGGRRAYDLARAGRAVELEARPVRVDRVELVAYEWPRLEVEVDCGAGTYIRSIARDVGEALGCGGLIEVLTRTRIGAFRLAEAVDPRGLSAEAVPGLLRPMTEAVPELPRVRLDAGQAALVARGQALDPRRLAPEPPAGELALVGPGGDLIALAEHDGRGGRVVPRRVFGG